MRLLWAAVVLSALAAAVTLAALQCASGLLQLEIPQPSPKLVTYAVEARVRWKPNVEYAVYPPPGATVVYVTSGVPVKLWAVCENGTRALLTEGACLVGVKYNLTGVKRLVLVVPEQGMVEVALTQIGPIKIDPRVVELYFEVSGLAEPELERLHELELEIERGREQVRALTTALAVSLALSASSAVAAAACAARARAKSGEESGAEAKSRARRDLVEELAGELLRSQR